MDFNTIDSSKRDFVIGSLRERGVSIDTMTVGQLNTMTREAAAIDNNSAELSWSEAAALVEKLATATTTPSTKPDTYRAYYRIFRGYPGVMKRDTLQYAARKGIRPEDIRFKQVGGGLLTVAYEIEVKGPKDKVDAFAKGFFGAVADSWAVTGTFERIR